MANLHERGTNPGTGFQTTGEAGRRQESRGGLTEVAGQVKEKVEGFASGAAHRLEQAWDTTRAGAECAWEDVNAFVRRHPFAVMAAAFGAGFLLAQAFSHWPTDMTRRMSESRYQG